MFISIPLGFALLRHGELMGPASMTTANSNKAGGQGPKAGRRGCALVNPKSKSNRPTHSVREGKGRPGNGANVTQNLFAIAPRKTKPYSMHWFMVLLVVCTSLGNLESH